MILKFWPRWPRKWPLNLSSLGGHPLDFNLNGVFEISGFHWSKWAIDCLFGKISIFKFVSSWKFEKCLMVPFRVIHLDIDTIDISPFLVSGYLDGQNSLDIQVSGYHNSTHHRECVSTGAAGARTRRSLGHHLLHPIILRLLVLCAPADFEAQISLL